MTLPPGPFILKNLPAFGGFNQLRMVVTDVEGNQQVFSRNFVRSSMLLRPGLSEFIVAAGVERENFGRDNFSYGNRVQLLAPIGRGF